MWGYIIHSNLILNFNKHYRATVLYWPLDVCMKNITLRTKLQWKWKMYVICNVFVAQILAITITMLIDRII